MALSTFQSVTASLVAPAVPPENYIKIPGIPSANAGALPAFSGILAKRYTTIDAMIDDGFSAVGPEVLAATQLISQTTSTPVTAWVIIDEGTFVAQLEEFTVNASADGTYELFLAPAVGLSGVLAATFAASGNTVTEIKDGLLTSFGLGAFAATHTGASVDADSGSITANVAGAAFVLTGSGPGGTGDITIDPLAATPNVGLYEALDAGFLEEKFWSVLPVPGTADGVVLEASRWAQDSEVANSDRKNLCQIQSSEAGIVDPLDTDNLALTLQLLQRDRTCGVYHPLDSDHMNAAVFGLYGGQQAGSRGAHMRPISGTAVLSQIGPVVQTPAFDQLLKDRNFGWIGRDGPGASDLARFKWGQTSGGSAVAPFFESIQAIDFWWLEVHAKLLEIQGSEDGWTLDDAGIGLLVAGVDGVNVKLAEFTPPVIDIAATVVTPTPLADIPAPERAVGDYKTSGGIRVDTVIIPRGRSIAVSGFFATA